MQISHDMEKNNANHADHQLTPSLDIIGQPQKGGMPDGHPQSKGCTTTAVQCAVIQEEKTPHAIPCPHQAAESKDARLLTQSTDEIQQGGSTGGSPWGHKGEQTTSSQGPMQQ
jgi:hypothetical protein